MCGIVGIVGQEPVAPLLVKSLERLEYRGYDSCGIATINSHGLEIRKGVGPVEEVAFQEALASAHGRLGIAHTRWATHGGVSRENAHPHLSCDGRFAVVHNGIISNHSLLRSELVGQGHRFVSETDTEVFAHLIEELSRLGLPVEEAFVQALRRLEGTFAISMIAEAEAERIFCARQKSPLILGIDSGTSYIGSDVNAFLPFTRKVVDLDDGEYAVVSPDGPCVRTLAARARRNRPVTEVHWSAESAEKGKFRHYMEKEIREQPEVVRRALEVPQEEIDELAGWMRKAERTFLIGVGTTYYVALFGQYLFAGLAGRFVPALSSDEAEPLAVMDDKSLLLAISQSGETFDTLQAIRRAKAAGAGTAAIVNVPSSSMTREAGLVIHQNSGPEICVISTKAALAQMVLLTRLAFSLAQGGKGGAPEMLPAIREELWKLPELLETALESAWDRVRELALAYARRPNWFFLGRGVYTPVAYESALKMKEVTYIHAEGMPAGFLKHGTLSLIENGTPCVFLMPPAAEAELYDLTMSSAAEVRAREGRVIALAFEEQNASFDEALILPQACSYVTPFLHLVAGQMLAYETAVILGRNVDRPRSLAKSVTVS